MMAISKCPCCGHVLNKAPKVQRFAKAKQPKNNDHTGWAYFGLDEGTVKETVLASRVSNPYIEEKTFILRRGRFLVVDWVEWPSGGVLISGYAGKRKVRTFLANEQGLKCHAEFYIAGSMK